MRHLLTRLCCVAALLLVLPTLAHAQATLAGTIKDASGAVLPGVTVEASSPALIEKVRTTVSDGSGNYAIASLPPGTYSVTFTLPGFTTVKREGVAISGAGVITIPIEMRVGGVQETITVTGETPVVDVQSTKRQTVLDNQLVNALPAARGYGALLNGVPAIQGGYQTAQIQPQMNFFTTHGGRPNEGKVQIDGLDVGAAFNGGGVSGFAYDTSNADELQVTVSGGLGESQTGGPTMNIVPRSGGNTVSGMFFGSTAGSWSQGNNIDDALKAIGIPSPAELHSAFDTSGSIGGPIRKDRVWFFGEARTYGSSQDVLGVFGNANAGDATKWTYVRDPNITARNVSRTSDYQGRLTVQASQRNKFGVSFDYQPVCAQAAYAKGGGGCRDRGDNWVASGSVFASPEANTTYNNGSSRILQGTWSSPLTSKMLLEAGVSSYHSRWGWMESPGSLTNLTPVTEVSTLYGLPGFTYRGLDNFFDNNYTNNNWRASASYVTGSHSMKFGYQGAYYIENTDDFTNSTGLTYTFFNGNPISFGWRINNWQEANRTRFDAFYAQDQWTIGRATVQGAVRYDRAWSWFPAGKNGAPQAGLFNPSPIQFPETKGVNAYNDITPRVGLAYDVFGNGKTAFKVNVGKYLQAATNQTQYVINNPALDARNGRGGPRFITNTSRAWTDVNGNKIPDCTILNPAAQNNTATGGDICGPWQNPSFGSAVAPLTINPDVLNGWGVRPNDWQFGVSVQQQIVPRVSVEVAYNRRWWGNFFVVDNRAVGPNDFIPYTVTAPSNANLPGGGGYAVNALLPTKLTQDNFYTFADDYGGITRYWHGVDVTANARLANGLTFTGGTSTGRGVRDECKVDAALPEMLFTGTTYQRQDGCSFAEKWLTTFRGSAAYTVPKIDVLVSGIVRFQNTAPGFFTTGDTLPGSSGNSLAANYVIPNTQILALAGALPPGALPTGTTTVNLNRAGEIFPPQVRTVDMRFAKVLRFGRTRSDIGIDLYNLFNTNQATAFNQTLIGNGATYMRPTTIVDPRFVRFNVTVRF